MVRQPRLSSTSCSLPPPPHTKNVKSSQAGVQVLARGTQDKSSEEAPSEGVDQDKSSEEAPSEGVDQDKSSEEAPSEEAGSNPRSPHLGGKSPR